MYSLLLSEMASTNGFDIHQESLKLHDNEVPYFIPNALDLEGMDETAIDQKLEGISISIIIQN